MEFDLLGVKAQDVDLNVKRNVLTVRAERPIFDVKDTEMIAAERPRGSSAGSCSWGTTWTLTGSRPSTTPVCCG